MLDQEIKGYENDIDLLRVEIEAGLKELGQNLNVDMASVDLLLRDEAGHQSLRQGQR